jgi:flavodoxin
MKLYRFSLTKTLLIPLIGIGVGAGLAARMMDRMLPPPVRYNRALVIYDTKYGNTARMAYSIGRGLRKGGAIPHVYRITAVRPQDLALYKLIVLGSPTINGNYTIGVETLFTKMKTVNINLTGQFGASFCTYMEEPKAISALSEKLKEFGANVIDNFSVKLSKPRGPVTRDDLDGCEFFGVKLAQKIASISTSTTAIKIPAQPTTAGPVFKSIFEEGVAKANEKAKTDPEIQNALREYNGRTFVLKVIDDTVYMFTFAAGGIALTVSPTTYPEDMYLETDRERLKKIIYEQRVDPMDLMTGKLKWRNIGLKEVNLVKRILGR